ncbi:MAG: lysophospholipid acyltransferase family protein [Sphingomonadaceae bacterium]|nr:lysophospholipid acyltransferase family protein [Sphingomonadaceae bacterium]
MSDAQPRFWRYWVRDVVAGARLWLLHGTLRLLPTEAASRIGGFIAGVAGPRLYPVAHARAGAIVRALRPDLAATDQDVAAAVARMWDCVGRAHAEFSAEDRLWAEGRMTVAGAEHLAAAAEGGRPVIAAGVHLGNWELIPIALGFLGHRVIDVYQPQPNRFVDRIAMRSRMRAANAVSKVTGRGVEEIFKLVAPSPKAGNDLVRALKAGWTMMMYVDEEVDKRVTSPGFDGEPPADGNMTRIARLARLTGAAVVPAYVERTRGARFVVHFLPPLAATKAVPLELAALNAATAAAIRRHLDQWFMLLSYRMG